LPPLKVLLPRDLHIGNQDFEGVEEGQDVEFEVVGSRFQQGDDAIVVLAKMREILKPATREESGAIASDEIGGLIAAPVGESKGDDDKRVVTVEVSQTKTANLGEPRRKRLVNVPSSTTNEPKS
jgi:hypothetical protein